ncbi:zinc-dependent alcohol dehydrogenase [Herbiconiux daphne]|uniref:Alcohol dehydrogenase catalytic domain-containing protein n=1 Tax=Herbiconiux daphne TaxID=2970914 RepID=A0ABT2H5G4_9MICO|nr:alcohol dehydrogenase catalytic domain-containing protein [Herbiconiux daphne]MCS5735161.1 alcohol dehydrogenase catalytic domain-containing protein [Herbiconiux daphne]
MTAHDSITATTELPSTMSAAVFHAAKDIRVETVPVPEPKPGEAVVRVLRSGMCGTDATEWVAGPKIFPITKPHRVTGHVGPMIPGHEFVGEIVSAPEGSGFEAGDVVASGAGVWCGECDRCLEGRTNMCDVYYTLGLSLDGGMAEYASTPVKNLAKVPEGLSIDAAGLAQPLAVGIHAARRSGAVDGDKVLVIGGGAIASFVLAGLKHLFDVQVTVVEFPGPKQERALRLGASSVVSPGDDLGDQVRESFGGSRPDVVIEASGAPGQLANAIAFVRDGGRVLAVGLPKVQPTIDVHSLVFREITLDSSLAHVCDSDLGAALDILAEGVLGEELIEQVVGLGDLGAQLDRLVAGQVDGKILVDPSR